MKAKFTKTCTALICSPLLFDVPSSVITMIPLEFSLFALLRWCMNLRSLLNTVGGSSAGILIAIIRLSLSHVHHYGFLSTM
jgi:hypothetical protein